MHFGEGKDQSGVVLLITIGTGLGAAILQRHKKNGMLLSQSLLTGFLRYEDQSNRGWHMHHSLYR